MKIRDQDRLVWFLEHLVRISMRRSAFHVAVGVCRLLYHYSTREVLAIYDVMAQSSACGPQDDTCRATKKLLLDKLAERFAPRLEIRRESRGERRITTRRTCPEDVALVQEALVRFTPWDTACGVPESFDPLADPLPALCPPGREPDQTHEVETRRIHAILHPPCLERVTAALGLGRSRWRLSASSPRCGRPARRCTIAGAEAVGADLPGLCGHGEGDSSRP